MYANGSHPNICPFFRDGFLSRFFPSTMKICSENDRPAIDSKRDKRLHSFFCWLELTEKWRIYTKIIITNHIHPKPIHSSIRPDLKTISKITSRATANVLYVRFYFQSLLLIYRDFIKKLHFKWQNKKRNSYSHRNDDGVSRLQYLRTRLLSSSRLQFFDLILFCDVIFLFFFQEFLSARLSNSLWASGDGGVSNV